MFDAVNGLLQPPAVQAFFGYNPNYLNIAQHCMPNGGVFPPACSNASAEMDIANSHVLQNALHVPSGTIWQTCNYWVWSALSQRTDPPVYDTAVATLRRGIPSVFYYGKNDIDVAHAEGFVVAAKLASLANYKNSTVADAPAAPWTGWRPLSIDGIRAGEQRKFQAGAGRLLFLQFDGAGHMMPQDRPEAFIMAMRMLLDEADSAFRDATLVSNSLVV